MRKHPNDRTIIDIQIISYFLAQTDLRNKFLKEFGDSSKNKLMYFCALFIEPQFCEKDSILFKEGDFGDCFYVIFKGRMNVLKNQENAINLNAEEYFKALIELEKKNLPEHLKSTVKHNKEAFHVKKKHVKYLNYILFLVKYRHLMRVGSGSKVFIELADRYGVDTFSMGIDLFKQENVSDKEYMIRSFDRMKHLLVPVELELSKYNYLEYDTRKIVYIHDRQAIISFGNGRLFGDIALQNRNNIRTATLQAIEDCYLGRIQQELYHDYISNEKHKTILKEIDFLSSNFFFKSIPIGAFKKKYFYDFVAIEMNKGQYLYNEKDQPDLIYFIKEGEVELRITSSLYELSKKVETLIDSTKAFDNRHEFVDDRSIISIENSVI